MPRRTHKIKLRAQYANQIREADRAKRRQRIANRKRDLLKATK